MPGRDIRFKTNNAYHVFSRSIDNKIVFHNKSYQTIFKNALWYYRSSMTQVRFSEFERLHDSIKDSINKQINDPETWIVNVCAYCLMPDHYHLLLIQKSNNGISKYISQVINSFTHFFNKRENRKGGLFLSPFKAIEIRTDEQFAHVSRYIHLNPYSSGIVSKMEDLISYSQNSYKTYITGHEDILVTQEPLLSLFGFDSRKYQEFVEGNAEYQRKLKISSRRLKRYFIFSRASYKASSP